MVPALIPPALCCRWLFFFLLFRFLSSGLCFSGFGGQGLPTRRPPHCLPGGRQLYSHISCIPCPCRKVTPPHPRATAPSQGKSQGTLPAQDSSFRGSHPSCQIPMGTSTPKLGTGQTCPCSSLCHHHPGAAPAPGSQGCPSGFSGPARAGNIAALFVLPLVSGAVQISAGFFEMKIKLIKVGQILRPGPRCWPKQWLFLLLSRLPQL